MLIKSSQVRSLALLFMPGERETVTKTLMVIFPAAFAWKKLPAESLRLYPYQFADNELGVEIYDYSHRLESVSIVGSPVRVGIWRPGRGEQEFNCGDYVYRVTEILKDGNFSVWRCAE